jgi:uncharacterized protein DUF1403
VIPAATASIQDADTRSAQHRARADSAGSVAPKSLSLQPFPAWIRRQSHANVDAHAPAFAAGAARASLDAMVRAEPPWRGVWAQRLALRAAAACLSREGRRGEEASLRDAHALVPNYAAAGANTSLRRRRSGKANMVSAAASTHSAAIRYRAGVVLPL